MKTKIWAICLMIITTFLTSIAQLFYKLASKNLELNLFSLITNYNLIIALTLYAIGAALTIIALKGGDLSVLYPIIATSYVWVGILSYFVFDESLNILRWLGILAIFFGVIFINVGGKHKEAEKA
jgi:drug/metabolite transporter (DMT)-like permease